MDLIKSLKNVCEIKQYLPMNARAIWINPCLILVSINC